MLDKLFHHDDPAKPDEKQQQIQATIQNLTSQIEQLRLELQSKNTQIEQLQSSQTSAAGSANTTAQATQQLQQQLSDLQRQLSEAQSNYKSATDLHQQKDQQIADLQAKLAAASAAAPSSAAAASGSAPSSAPTASGSAPSSAPATGGLAVGGQAWVTREGGMNLRLRTGAGLHSEVIGSLHPETQMTLLAGPEQADNYSWWHIRTSDGREGWVAGQDLRSQPD